MNTADLMRRMTAAGAPPEAIAIAMEALQEVTTERRTKDAERQRKYRKLSRDKRDTSRDTGEQNTSPSVNGHVPPATALKNGSESGVTQNKQGSLSLSSSVDRPTEVQQTEGEQVEARDTVLFGQFWDAYPNKVGKEAARKAFKKTRRKRVEFAVLMAGLTRYAAKTDDRPWCNPATWLNQHRWDDQPATGPPGANGARFQPNTAKERTFNALEQLYRPGSNGPRRGPPNSAKVSGVLSDDRSG